MAVFRCKMCGGDLPMTEGASSCTCEFCGTEQTIPSVKDENLQGLFNRANVLRMKSEFDKAEEIYERILQSSESEAEAYWGLILCKYGIEYVEDPTTFKRILTCHRTSYDAITADEDYRNALKYADVVQRGIYEAEAKAIDEIQKGILTISQKEDPYDVFICYKETDENGKRTQDSIIANDIYYQLTQEGFKVFYAVITLEDKLGSEYEPYIFSALNTAKVMLSLGTKPEYFSAVWVKNEWSRFLKLMKKDRSKMLIPCYRDMDAYELPEEFAHLQAQDMSKIGFVNDLVRSIKKVVTKDDKSTSVKETVVVNGGSTSAAPLLKRAVMFLEDGDWAKADDFCEQVLNIDPENAQAYVGKLMAELKVHRQADLVNCEDPFDNRNSYKKAVRFASPELRDELEDYVESIKDRNETNRLNGIYNDAEKKYAAANTEAEYKEAAEIFQSISNWKDASKRAADTLAKAEEARKNKIYDEAVRDTKSTEPDVIMSAVPRLESIAGWKDATEIALTCPGLAEEARKQLIYNSAIQKAKMNTIGSYKEAIGIMQEIKGWKDVNSKISEYEACISDLNEKAEADRRAEAQREKERKAVAAKKKRNIIIASIAAAVCVAVIIVVTTVIIPSSKYSKASDLVAQGSYAEAMEIFHDIDSFKDSHEEYTKAFNALKADYKSKGDEYLAAGDEINAAIMYTRAGEIGLANRTYDFGTKLVANKMVSIGVTARGKVYYPSNNNSLGDTSNLKNMKTISGIDDYDGAVGITLDGKIVGEKSGSISYDLMDECASWTNVKQLEIGYLQAFALLEDGTVTAAFDKDDKYCYPVDASSWENIVQIGNIYYDLWGLDASGTVHYAATQKGNEGRNFNLSEFINIEKVLKYDDYMVGLKTDNTVVYAVDKKASNVEAFPISDLSDITDITAAEGWLIAVKEDGTIICGTNGCTSKEYDYSGYLDTVNKSLGSWNGIVSVLPCARGVVGIKYDGTVAYQSLDKDSNSNTKTYSYVEHSDVKSTVESWNDILYIDYCVWDYAYVNWNHVLGLHADGTVSSLGTGEYYYLEEGSDGEYHASSGTGGIYDVVSSWNLFN